MNGAVAGTNAARSGPSAIPQGRVPASRPGWLVLSLRAIVHGVTGVALVMPLAGTGAAAISALGGVLGGLVAMRASRSRVRTYAWLMLGAAISACVVWLRGVMVDTDLLPGLLGASDAFMFAEVVLFFGLLFCAFFMLRVVSARRPIFAALEVLMVGGAFAQLLIMHRNGAINRPFELADPILAAGGDPRSVFLGVGAAATAIVLALLFAENSAGRAALHAVAGAALLLLLFFGTMLIGIPATELPDTGVGLGGSQQRDRDGEGEGDSEQPPSGDQELQDPPETPPPPYPVGVVVFRQDYSPPGGTYYFRQAAHSQYNGRRLVAASGVSNRRDGDIAAAYPTTRTPVATPPPLNAFRREVRTTVALLGEHGLPFGLESPLSFEPVQNPDPTRFVVTYDVVSAAMDADHYAVLDAEAGDPSWDAETLAHYTRAPADPRYRALAEEILQEQLPEQYRERPGARAIAVSQWLSENVIYSLRARHAQADDPAADFLFGDRVGYCQHFAHSAAYLLRSVGVPARVATGYAVPEASRQGGSALLIMGGAAHAWPEVYFAGLGWVIFDIYPQESLDPEPPPPDPDLQRLLGELARGQSTAPPDAGNELASLWQDFLDLLAGAVHLLWLLLAFVLGLYAVKAYRRLAPRFADHETLPFALYRAELDRLSDVAIRRQPGETREAFARRMRTEMPSLVPLTDLHVATAFGSRRARADVARDQDAVRRVATSATDERRATYPLWRRLLGALLPWTWLRAR